MQVDSHSLADQGLTGLTVGTVMRETLGTTLAFVSWYLREGADQVVICFDDPNDPAIAVLDHMPQVLCLPATPDFWARAGVEPDARFTKRQNKAMQLVYESLRSGWFLNVDGDELVFMEDRHIADELAATPADVRSVTWLPVENVQAPGAGDRMVFRSLMDRRAAKAVYGDFAPMMIKRGGLSGHRVGKTATRAGLKGMIVRQHFLQDARTADTVMDRVIGPAEGAYLLHFFDQGYDVWRAKLPWRLSSRGFAARAGAVLHAILESPDPEPQLFKVYEQLHVFDAARRDLLHAHNALLELRLDVAELSAATFPGVKGPPGEKVLYAL